MNHSLRGYEPKHYHHTEQPKSLQSFKAVSVDEPSTSLLLMAGFLVGYLFRKWARS